MLTSSKNVNLRLSKFLPDQDNLLSLDQYNKMYREMLERQKAISTQEDVEKIEDQHRTIVSNCLSSKVKNMKKERNKK